MARAVRPVRAMDQRPDSSSAARCGYPWSSRGYSTSSTSCVRRGNRVMLTAELIDHWWLRGWSG
ncbi:hypothetical protein ACFP2T_08840 [Plantactinospora solaniradicis]|uniref:Uncharacterized protein n=1 Tax=Plantactinospora solaniradicis TaxID=1723736 RepID=A0ABW1K5N0_9ACTN